SSAYGVHAFAPAGKGSSPRCAIQIRSGVSAYTAPTDPQVQPSCFRPSAASASGLGQSGTSSYGPVSSWPPFSCAAAVAGPAGAFAPGRGCDEQPTAIAADRRPAASTIRNGSRVIWSFPPSG